MRQPSEFDLRLAAFCGFKIQYQLALNDPEHREGEHWTCEYYDTKKEAEDAYAASPKARHNKQLSVCLDGGSEVPNYKHDRDACAKILAAIEKKGRAREFTQHLAKINWEYKLPPFRSWKDEWVALNSTAETIALAAATMFGIKID